MTEDQQMAVWLRQQILARKAIAEAARHAGPGAWRVTENDGEMWVQQADCSDEVATDRLTSPEEYIPLDPAHVAHIAANDPRDTIARCEAELRILNDYEDFAKVAADHPSPPGETSWAEQIAGTLGDVVGDLAYAYRHWSGFDPDWYINASNIDEE